MDTVNRNPEFERVEDFAKTVGELRFSLCPLLIPGKADHQGDVASAEEIEKAAWGMPLHGGLLDIEHSLVNKNLGEPVEKYILPGDTLFPTVDKLSPENEERVKKIAELQKAIADTEEARLIPKGSLMLGVRWTPETWKQIKSGERRSMSIYGRGSREEIKS